MTITVTKVNGSFAVTKTETTFIEDGVLKSTVVTETQKSVTTAKSITPANLLSVVSRKTHGAAGDFDVPLDHTIAIGSAVSVEPRVGPNHKIIFTFDQPITAPGSVSCLDSLGAAFGAAVASAVGNTVVVDIAGAPDAKRAAINLSNVNGATSAAVNAGFLVGDINNSRIVNITDLNSISVNDNQPASATVVSGQPQFRRDVDLDGVITAASDRIIAAVNSGVAI